MRDFTLTTYKKLLASLQKADYAFYTFEDWCDGKAQGRYVLLRHDVDLKTKNSLTFAGIEAEMGIRATYYFRVIPNPDEMGVIHSIAALGHEIGYHYEDLSLFRGDKEKAITHFQHQLELFRQFYPVRTICMHGSPLSKWDNRDLWKTYQYTDYGIIGEPYLDFLNKRSDADSDIVYFTDTARMWDGDKYNLRDKKTLNSDQLSVISDQLLMMNDQLKENIDSETINSHQETFISIPELNNDDDSSPHQIITSAHHHITPSSHHYIIHSSFDFIAWLKSNPSQNIMMITTHPQRWTNNTIEWMIEFALQNIKNFVKHWFIIRRYKK